MLNSPAPSDPNVLPNVMPGYCPFRIHTLSQVSVTAVHPLPQAEAYVSVIEGYSAKLDKYLASVERGNGTVLEHGVMIGWLALRWRPLNDEGPHGLGQGRPSSHIGRIQATCECETTTGRSP